MWSERVAATVAVRDCALSPSTIGRSALEEFLESHPHPGGYDYLLLEMSTQGCRDARGEVVDGIAARARVLSARLPLPPASPDP